MTIGKAAQSPEETNLHRATDRALDQFDRAKVQAWDKLQKALDAAFRQYDRDIAPFERACNRRIARANRDYTREIKKIGGER